MSVTNIDVILITGPAGPQGPSVTVIDSLVNGNLSAVTSNAVFDGLALKAPLASPSFTGTVNAPGGFVSDNGSFVASGSGFISTASGDISTFNGQIYSVGTNAKIYTNGASAHIETSGPSAHIRTTGGGNIISGGNLTAGTGITSATGNVTATNGNIVATVGQFIGAGTGLTGTAASLTAGAVTTIGNLTGVVTSTNRATAIADGALSIAKTSGLQPALDAAFLTANLPEVYNSRLASVVSAPAGRAMLTVPTIAAARVQLGIDPSLDLISHDFEKQSFGFTNTDPGLQRTLYQERQAQATIDMVVTGGSLAVNTITQGAAGPLGARSVLVEEAGYPPVMVSGTVDNVVQTANLTLNSNPATVRITEGLTGTGAPGNEGSVELGTRLTKLTASTLVKLSAPKLPTHRLVMVGDSITIGDNGNTPNGNPLRDAAVSLLRRCGVWNSTAIGRGWAGWKDWSVSPEKLVEQILFAADGTTANVIWISLGTNDYGLALQTPALVQVQVARVLKMIRAVLPNAIIYVQTPLIRTTETANGLGFTLTNYRTAITQGVTDSGIAATAIDGQSILTTGDLQDGVHPSSLGHAKWAISMQTSITQTVYPQKYTAGIFSALNYFSSTPGTGQANLGIGKSLIICWYQYAGGTGSRIIAGYYEGLYGAGTGWLLLVDTATNVVNMLTRPTGAANLGATGVGWHCMALAYADATTFQASLDGGAVTNYSIGYTAASVTAKIGIGADGGGGGAPAITEEVSGVAVLDYQLTEAELVAASKFGQARGSLTLAQNAISGARFMWTAENYNSTLATQPSLGSFPVTLTRNGAIARNLRA